MAFTEKTSQPFISTKRPLDDADDQELDEFRKPKTIARKYPPPKIRIGVEAVRDSPPDCGILHDLVESKTDKNPWKKPDIEKSNKSQALGFSMPSTLKSPRKVKFFDHITQVVHDFPPVSRIIKERKPFKSPLKVKNFHSKNQVGHDFPPVSRITQERKPLKSPQKVIISASKNLVVHDLPSVSRIIQERKPLKDLDNVESKLGFNKPSFVKRKVKYWDGTSNGDNAPAPEPKPVTTTIASHNEQIRRKDIHKAMLLFDEVYNQLSKENGSKQMVQKLAPCKVTMDASRIVQQIMKWMNADKALGEICGVQPGDKFRFRSQLQLVGIHCQPHCGIDYANINGKNVALSIVDSHRYPNESQTSDMLTYCGEGGHEVSGWSSRNVPPDDQKLKRGNLELKNSMVEKSPVRVIRKVFGVYNKSFDMFVYDGLYTVENYTKKRGSEGKLIFMFELRRTTGQCQVKWVNGGDVTSYNHSTFQMV